MCNLYDPTVYMEAKIIKIFQDFDFIAFVSPCCRPKQFRSLGLWAVEFRTLGLQGSWLLGFSGRSTLG